MHDVIFRIQSFSFSTASQSCKRNLEKSNRRVLSVNSFLCVFACVGDGQVLIKGAGDGSSDNAVMIPVMLLMLRKTIIIAKCKLFQHKQ